MKIARDTYLEKIKKMMGNGLVVNRGARRVYVQSAWNMADEKKRTSERRSLLQTGDFFRKMIVTGGNDRLTLDEDGIVHVGVIPFLLDESVLGV